MLSKDKANLLAIIDSCEKISVFTKDINHAEGFYENEVVFDAVLMNFINIGESVARLSATLTSMEEQIPWTKIKQLRNIVAHDYFGIDAEEIWQIVQNHLPELEQNIQTLLNRNKAT